MSLVKDRATDLMLVTLQRESLKYSCGYAMFCPACQSVLDCRRAVEVTISEHIIEEGFARDRPVRVQVLCANCYDRTSPERIVDALIATLALALGRRLPHILELEGQLWLPGLQDPRPMINLTAEVLDGRVLWEAEIRAAHRAGALKQARPRKPARPRAQARAKKGKK